MAAGPDLLPDHEISDRTKAILAQVGGEATRRGVAPAEPQDVLRAILLEGQGIACAALDGLGADRAALLAVASLAPTERPSIPPRQAGTDDSLPLGLLRAANLEATALGHRYVGTEHLLLALASPQYPAVARLLAEHGVTLAAARAMIAELLGRQLSAR